MPYRLSKDGLCVEKQDGEKWVEMKCHDSKADAEAHMAALNKNVTAKESLIQEAGGSKEDFINQVRQAFDKFWRMMDLGMWCWVVDTFDDHLVCRMDDKYFLVTMTINGDEMKFADRADWQRVMLDYVPVSSAAETADTAEAGADAVQESLRLDVTLPVHEVRTDDDGTIDGVIVVEGESANGNVYTGASLQSGVTVFSGALMFADHPTRTEESQRPERSVRDVVGRVREAYVGSTKDGKPALRGKFQISEAESALKTKITEGILGDLSLRAFGQGKRDKAGKFVVESFQRNPFTSVDVVTVAAAGGGFEALAEADRQVIRQAVLESLTPEQLQQARPDLTSAASAAGAVAETETPTETRPLSEADTQLHEVLQERDRLLEENTRLFRAVRTGQAEKLLGEVVKKAGALPQATLKRIVDQTKPIVEAFATHGSAQTEPDLAAALGQVVEAEKAYLAQLVPNGAVVGLTLPGGEVAVDGILSEAFTGLVPDAQIPVAVRGRG